MSARVESAAGESNPAVVSVFVRMRVNNFDSNTCSVVDDKKSFMKSSNPQSPCSWSFEPDAARL